MTRETCKGNLAHVLSDLIVAPLEELLKLGAARLALRGGRGWRWLALLWFSAIEAIIFMPDTLTYVEGVFGYGGFALWAAALFMNLSARVGHVLSSALYLRAGDWKLPLVAGTLCHFVYNQVVGGMANPAAVEAAGSALPLALHGPLALLFPLIASLVCWSPVLVLLLRARRRVAPPGETPYEGQP